MSEPNKSSNPLHTILFKSPWSLRFSFILTLLLVILSFANIVLFSFLGMQINSMVFLIFSLVSFVFVFIASLKTTAGKTTLNWVMFLIAVIAVVIAAATTNLFKSVPKVELDNISNTLIALSFGCTAIFAFCNSYEPIEGASEGTVTEETATETLVETPESDTIEEVSEENMEINDKEE